MSKKNPVKKVTKLPKNPIPKKAGKGDEPTIEDYQKEIMNLRKVIETLKQVIVKNQVESLAKG